MNPNTIPTSSLVVIALSKEAFNLGWSIRFSDDGQWIVAICNADKKQPRIVKGYRLTVDGWVLVTNVPTDLELRGTPVPEPEEQDE